MPLDSYDPKVLEYLQKRGLIKNPLNPPAPAPSVELPAPDPSVPAAPSTPPADPINGNFGLKEALAVSLSGLGDAMKVSAGRPGGTAAASTLDIIQKAPDQAAARVKVARELGEAKEGDDPNSAASAFVRPLVEKFAGVAPGSFKTMTYNQAIKHMPVLEKAWQANEANKSREQIAEDNRLSREAMLKIAQSNRADLLHDKQDNVAKEAMVKKFASELPKMKTEATTASTNLKSINKAIGMIGKGVTGKEGQLKSFLAPYAELAGIETKGMNEAQTFQLLSRAIVGPMRMDIIGPGAVSEWEQKLMQQMSGGGGTGKAAAKELLTRYRDLAKNKVKGYNDASSSASSLSPDFSIAYQPMEMEADSDDSGYVVGQKYTMKDGKQATYKGGGRFE